MYSACGESTTAQGVLVAALQEVVANADWKELWVLLGQVRVWLERGLPRMQQGVEQPWWLRVARAGDKGTEEVSNY